MNHEIIAETERIERERYDKFLSHLGFTHKGKFDLKDHDFTLDNYCPVGDCWIMLTLDSMKVLNCQILEYWEVQDTEDCLSNTDLIEGTLNAAKDLHYGAIA